MAVVSAMKVYLVIDPHSGLGPAVLDCDRAHEYARNTGGMVVEVPVVADYRPQAAACQCACHITHPGASMACCGGERT